LFCFFFSSRRRHTRFSRDWSSDVCSSDLFLQAAAVRQAGQWVMLGKIVDVSLRAGLFGDVGGGAPETEVRAVEQDRTRRQAIMRSEERRVGKECRSRWSPYR